MKLSGSAEILQEQTLDIVAVAACLAIGFKITTRHQSFKRNLQSASEGGGPPDGVELQVA